MTSEESGGCKQTSARVECRKAELLANTSARTAVAASVYASAEGVKADGATLRRQQQSIGAAAERWQECAGTAEREGESRAASRVEDTARECERMEQLRRESVNVSQ